MTYTRNTWEYDQKAQTPESVKQILQKNQAKAQATNESGSSTAVDKAQTNPGTDHVKVVERWPH